MKVTFILDFTSFVYLSMAAKTEYLFHTTIVQEAGLTIRFLELLLKHPRKATTT